MSSLTLAPWRLAASSAGKPIHSGPSECARADSDHDAGPVPAPTITCFVCGGQWTKSHARNGRSSPSTIKCFAGDDEEVLLVGLPVVQRHRLARREHERIDAELRELRAGPRSRRRRRSAPRPSRDASRRRACSGRTTLALRGEPVLGLLELRLRGSLSPWRRRARRERLPAPSAATRISRGPSEAMPSNAESVASVTR